MGWPQIVFGTLLVLGVLGVAVGFGWSQLRALQALRAQPDLPDEEQQYQRRQAWRRLIGSGLTLILAVLLAVILLFLENATQRLTDFIDAHPRGTELSPEQRDLARLYAWLWIVLLLILFVLLLLAAYEMWSVRRHGLRERRKLQNDRREMIERQADRLRRERNGHDGRS